VVQEFCSPKSYTQRSPVRVADRYEMGVRRYHVAELGQYSVAVHLELRQNIAHSVAVLYIAVIL
jgi:hypothetical protein